MNARHLVDIDDILPFDIVEIVSCPSPRPQSPSAGPLRETAFRHDVWLPDDIVALQAAFRADMPLLDIAAALDRTLDAVRTKVCDLGLRRNSSRPWTEFDDRHLIARYGAVASATVAAELGRTVTAVYARACALGLTEPASPEWTAWEDAQLAAGYAQGTTVAFLAALIGRPLSGAVARARILGLTHLNARLNWTADEETRALQLVDAGMTARQIGDALGTEGMTARSRSAVKQMLRSLGVDRDWGRPWIPEEEDALRHAYAASASISRLARRLGRGRSSLSWKAGTLGLTGTHARAGRGFRQGEDWTEAETATLTARYGTEPARATAALLGRPVRAIYVKANHLGLSAGFFKNWDADEDRAVALAYHHQISIGGLAKALDRDITMVSKRAAKLGIPFKDRPKAPRHPRRDWALADLLALDPTSSSALPLRAPPLDRHAS